MSKRFQRWVQTWIEGNVSPHANVDIESDAARAERLTKALFADAGAAGFTEFEIREERERVPRLIQTAVADRTDFNADSYKLAWQLAQEHEDGD